MSIFEDPIYEKNGTFQAFLKQTNEKEVTIDYILSQLKGKYDLKFYDEFCFSDLGAGDGTLTLPIIQFLRKNTKKLDVYCIEPSPLIDVLKKRCGPEAHYICYGMEDAVLPRSDFILLSHAMQYLTDRKSFAKKIDDALNEGGKMLVVGTHPDSQDLRFNRELRPREKQQIQKKPKENLFEYLESYGFKVTREYKESVIDLTNALKLKGKGKDVISFCYHRPFLELSENDIAKFRELAARLAPDKKLSKTLQFVWVEKG